MISLAFARRLLLGLSTGCAIAIAGLSAPIVAGALTPAMAQSTEDFDAALDAYGHWVRLPRYGEVWVPDGVPPDWRPYEYGHWVYTDDWGWYWVSDEEEADWGWVVYHYGRWIHDRGSWFWVPGDEWAPAWVDWRYGGADIGWAPMPPDDLIDAYDDDAEYWTFVPMRYIGEPRLRRYYVPRDRRRVILRSTRIINRPVHVEGRRIWVNPGLSPGFISGRTHVTLHAYNVRPRVFGATAGVTGAVTIHRDQLRTKGAIKSVAPVTVQRTTVSIQPTVGTPPPKPLGKGERGQLGSHPPRAAQGAVAPQPQGPAGTPPPKGPATIQQHNGSPPAVKPVTPPGPPKALTPERHEERRIETPPGGGAPPKPSVVRPVTPTPPKAVTPERHEERRIETPRGGGVPPKPSVVHPVTPPPPKQPAPPPAARQVQPQLHAPPAPHGPPPGAKPPQPKAPPKEPPKTGDNPPPPPR
jgi:hypothetical protein